MMVRHVIANILYVLCGADVAGMIFALSYAQDQLLYIIFAASLVALLIPAMLIDKCAKTLPYERFK